MVIRSYAIRSHPERQHALNIASISLLGTRQVMPAHWRRAALSNGKI